MECDFVVQEQENVKELIQVTWDMYDDDTRSREINAMYCVFFYILHCVSS